MPTVENLLEALPASLMHTGSLQLSDKFEERTTELRLGPETSRRMLEVVRDGLHLLESGPAAIDDYLDAAIFVGFRSMGCSWFESYKRAFPKRYLELRARAATDEEIASEAAALSSTNLVRRLENHSRYPAGSANPSPS